MKKVSKEQYEDHLFNNLKDSVKVGVSSKWPHSICWKDRHNGELLAMEVPSGNKYDYYIKNQHKMTEEQFEKHVDERIEKIIQVLQIKAKEYRKNDNPFHNFDRAAAMNDCTPERALMGMLAKHQISVLDLVDDIDQGKLPNGDLVAEKIGDHINYLILLEGLIYRRLSEYLANVDGIGAVQEPCSTTISITN